MLELTRRLTAGGPAAAAGAAVATGATATPATVGTGAAAMVWPCVCVCVREGEVREVLLRYKSERKVAPGTSLLGTARGGELRAAAAVVGAGLLRSAGGLVRLPFVGGIGAVGASIEDEDEDVGRI